ncbi:MAG: Gfo/Idh/MocA family oxidoreductase [Kiritimatiellia bacterium]
MKKSYRAVLVGCGGISNAWLKVLLPMENVVLVGMVDLNLSNVDAKIAEHSLSGVQTGTDLDPMLTDLKPDVVFDCTVPPAHESVVLTALQHGCHVLGEKPLAENMSQARKMVAAAEAAGTTYGVMQNRRWHSGIQRLRRALDQGIIGKVHTLHSDFFLGCHFGGFREEMKHVLLLDMAIHSFDQVRCLIDALPLSVIATEWNPPGSWYQHGASATAHFELENHCAFSYRGSWCAEGLNTTWECAWRIIGERGSLLWDGGDHIEAEVVKGDEGFIRPTEKVEIPPFSLSDTQTGHSGAIHNFIDCLDAGAVPETPGSDNIHSLAMVHAAIQSAETGRRVYLSDLL